MHEGGELPLSAGVGCYHAVVREGSDVSVEYPDAVDDDALRRHCN
jgi:hypothetical protein